APFPPELPAAPAAPAAPPDPPEAARPLVLLLQPPTTRAAVTTIAQDFHATRCLIVTLPSERAHGVRLPDKSASNLYVPTNGSTPAERAYRSRSCRAGSTPPRCARCCA